MILRTYSFATRYSVSPVTDLRACDPAYRDLVLDLVMTFFKCFKQFPLTCGRFTKRGPVLSRSNLDASACICLLPPHPPPSPGLQWSLQDVHVRTSDVHVFVCCSLAGSCYERCICLFSDLCQLLTGIDLPTDWSAIMKSCRNA